ncbi:hypothetical protein BLA14095_00740 [Burkholderia lata]|nr:hypothetical protein BLA14095_00740 [Burkholderia lata]
MASSCLVHSTRQPLRSLHDPANRFEHKHLGFLFAAHKSAAALLCFLQRCVTLRLAIPADGHEQWCACADWAERQFVDARFERCCIRAPGFSLGYRGVALGRQRFEDLQQVEHSKLGVDNVIGAVVWQYRACDTREFGGDGLVHKRHLSHVERPLLCRVGDLGFSIDGRSDRRRRRRWRAAGEPIHVFVATLAFLFRRLPCLACDSVPS